MPTRIRIPDEIRQAYLGYACEMCGTDQRDLLLHHIDRDRLNNDPSNLQTLCWSCHTALHMAEDGLNVRGNAKGTPIHPHAVAAMFTPQAIALSRDWAAARKRRKAVYELHMQGLNLREIAEQFGISRERVRQLVEKAKTETAPVAACVQGGS